MGLGTQTKWLVRYRRCSLGAVMSEGLYAMFYQLLLDYPDADPLSFSLGNFIRREF